MRILTALALLSLVLAAGCSSAHSPGATPASRSETPQSVEASIGVNIFKDDPSLPRADAAGDAPEDVVREYVAACNASDPKTAYSLHWHGEGDSETVTPEWTEAPQPYKDFALHEVRVTDADRALVRVTYSTTGFSAIDGTMGTVAVSAPGEWWVIQKSGGLWKVTSKGPWD